MCTVTVLTVLLVHLAAGQAPSAAIAHASINERRHLDDRAPVTYDDRLSVLAASYLEDVADARCLCPPGADDLLRDVLIATGAVPGTTLRAGVVVTYGVDERAAFRNASDDRRFGAALLEPAMSSIGYSSSVVPHDMEWLATPIGGDGADVSLAGFVILVIVTTGRSDD